MATHSDMPIVRLQTAALLGELASAALMALGGMTLLGIIAALVLLGNLTGIIAEVGFRFAFADTWMRGDMLRDAVFEATVVWTLIFFAILWLRHGVAANSITKHTAGGHYGD